MTDSTIKNGDKKGKKEAPSYQNPSQNKTKDFAQPNNTVNFHPDIPHRAIEMPRRQKLSEHNLSINADDNQLTVGRNIVLSGKIDACEKLIVEGRVEATLNDAHTIDVKSRGYFKGKATVKDANISGKFEGTLKAVDLLTIYNGGQIEGSVRYGRIIIESGGEIIGDMAAIDEVKKDTSKS